MKVISWRKKLTFSQSLSPCRSRLRKRVSSLSRLLSPGLRGEKRRTERCVLMPLRIRLDRPDQVKVRKDSVCDRSEIRQILQQRVRQRIRERSMAAILSEARTQLNRESTEEDIYVPVDFSRERNIPKDRQSQEEDLYISMS